MFVRYDDGYTRINIETTKKGKLFNDTCGYFIHPIMPEMISNGTYMANLSKKEILASVLNWRGIKKYENGEYNDAITDFEKAINLNPDMPELYSSLAKVYKLMGKLKESLVLSNKAIEIYPEFAIALANRGNTKFKLGDKEGAFEDYCLAIKIYLNPASDFSCLFWTNIIN